MQTTTSPQQLERILPAAILNNPILSGLSKVDYQEWLRIKALADLFIKPTMKAPRDVEIAHKMLVQMTPGPHLPYGKFCQSYLYRKLLKGILSIEPFIDSFDMKDDYVKQVSFWRESFRLITKRIQQLHYSPTISSYIGWIPYLPALWKQAFPGIDNKAYRDLILKQK